MEHSTGLVETKSAVPDEVKESVIGSNRKTAEVLQTLEPQEIIDDEGGKHSLYSFTTANGHSVKALFYSPDELPFNTEVMAGKKVFVFGDKPDNRDADAWDGFLNKIKENNDSFEIPNQASTIALNEAVNSDNALFCVESSLKNMLDLVSMLGVRDPDLQTIRQEANRHHLSDQANKMIDQIIAAKLFDDTGELRTTKNTDGESLMVLALQGNDDANTVLAAKYSTLLEKQNLRQQELLEEYGRDLREDIDPLKLEDLVAVHLTKYFPNGNSMQSTFDATGWESPRNTVHFALNHPVASHMYGSWDDTLYAIVSPLGSLIGKNGNPVLNTIDTFFEISPGQDLELPDGTVIVRPGETGEGNIFDLSRDKVKTYKAGGYTAEDVQAINGFLKPSEYDYLNADIAGAIKNGLQYSENGQFLSLTPEEDDKIDLAFGGHTRRLGYRERRDILNLLSQASISGVVSSLLSEIGDQGCGGKVGKISSEIQKRLTTVIKEEAVRKTIVDQGFTVHSGGMWAWDGDSHRATDQTQLLAHELGTICAPHSGTNNFVISDKLGWGQLETKDGTRKPYEKFDLADSDNQELLTKATLPSLRMAYLVGAI